jgi:hypothetical protein
MGQNAPQLLPALVSQGALGIGHSGVRVLRDSVTQYVEEHQPYPPVRLGSLPA